MADDIDELRAREQQAKTLQEAAAIFDEMLGHQSEMMEDGELPTDDDSEAMLDDMETARDMCQQLSVSMVLALAQEGYIADLSDDEDDEAAHGGAFQ